MRADFSRHGFDARKHYSAVLHQQGRVITDADLNEEHALQEYRSGRTGADAIGAVGVPERAPGFGITVGAGGALTISGGRLYVDGVLFENEANLGYAGQQHWPALPATPGADVRQQLTSAGASIGLVYLEGFGRTVTALDDDAIRDVALGGPDTSARTQIVWRVAVQPIAAAANGIALTAAAIAALATRIDEVATARANLAAATTDAQRRTRRQELTARRRSLRIDASAAGLSCGRDYAEWTALITPRTGRITVGTNPATPAASPCDVPPGSGYFSGENQLYRIEVHATGAAASNTDSTFKFSRENGSVAALIEAAGATTTGTVTASQVRVSSTGRDVDLGFADSQWVEYVDDALELAGLSGPLVQIQRVRRETSIVELMTPIEIRFGLHPKLRRWDQTGAAATAGGVAMGAAPVPLERNLRITFEPGTYRAGDYWVFPARGGVPDTHLPSGAQPPAGVRRHYARLALLLLDASNQLRVLFDCRPNLPELTALEAEDVRYTSICDDLVDAVNVQEALDILCQRRSGTCTVSVVAGNDIAAAFARLTAGQSADVCFAAGNYELPATIRVTGLGHLTISGCGAATRIRAAAEAAFVFERCLSVVVRDCSVEATRSGTSEGAARMNGALTFDNCEAVTVDGAQVQCASGPVRAATCITVRQPAAITNETGAGLVRIRHCDLSIGHFQTGILLVNVARADVQDNVLQARGVLDTERWLRHPEYRALYLRHFMSRVVRGAATAAQVAATNAQVTFNTHQIHFRTDPTLTGPRTNNVWQTYINAVNPTGITSPAALHEFLEGAMRQVLSTGLLPPQMPATVRTARQALVAQDRIVASQGIVVGGARGTHLRIVGNTIQDASQGIHVGVSHHTAGPGAPDVFEYAHVEANTVRVRIGSATMRERHGIFLGNVASLAVRDNYVVATRSQKTATLRLEGIRVFGHVDRRVIVQANHLAGCTVGVRFEPQTTFPRPQWIITDNLAVQSSQAVDAPAAIRDRIRGLAENFA